MKSKPSTISKTLSMFLAFFSLTLFMGIFWFVPKQVKAEFSEDFSTTSKIGSLSGAKVDTSAKTTSLPYYENSLDDADTLLLSHLGSASDITSPAIGVGGTASTTVTYVGGYDGNGAQLPTSSSPTLYFPKSGNLNQQRGTISFWASSTDWGQNNVLFGESDSSYGLMARYRNSTQIAFFLGGNFQYYSTGALSTSTWHHFVFSWDCTAGVQYVQVDNLAGATKNFTASSACSYSTSSGNLALGWSLSYYNTVPTMAFDELRITNTLYSSEMNYSYANTYANGIVTSAALDTGVASPVWGNIEWTDSDVATGTPIYIQTNVSSDNSTWDGWLRKGMVSFTYDDYGKSVYDNAKPIFDQYGWKATIYVITNAITDVDPNPNPNYMSVANLLTLQTVGWEIGSHGVQHLDLNSLNEAQIRTEFGDSATYLEGKGINVKGMATPYGTHPGTGNEYILDDYYTYVRGGGGYTTVGNANSSYLNYGPFNILWVYAQTSSNLAAAESYVDNVVTNKQWVVFVDHFVDPGDALLTPLTAYIATKDVDVVTVAGGMEKLSYQTSAGSQITNANKRYIRYRAILFTTASTTAPVLSSVTIREPAHIYKELTNTINANGIYTHSVWPQTTDTELSNLTITPSADSVDVAVDTWNTSGNYYKKWIESSTTHNITTSHTIGDLRANQYYQIKVGGTVLQTLQANSSGQISFTYSDGYSDKTFEIEEIPTAPTIGTPTVLSSSAIRWNFTCTADNETGFRLYTNADVQATSSAIANLTYLDETGLSENTQYTGRYVKAYNTYGSSAASSTAASKYTLADTPTNLDNSATRDVISLTVDSFPNASAGSSGYYFYRTDKPTRNSGWISKNSWTDTGLTCGSKYTYGVKYRNGDGVATSAVTLSQNTEPCVSEGGASENDNIDKEATPASPKKTDLNPQGDFSIVVNGDAEYTNSRTVKLKLFAGSDTKYMMISENTNFSGAVQEKYVPDKTWTLSRGDGKKTIYAKFLTLYDVASKTVSDSIILDTTAPTLSITEPKNYSSLTDDTPTIKGTSEPDSSIVLELQTQDGAKSYYSTETDREGNYEYTFLSPLKNGDYTLNITSQDQVGNLSKAQTIHFKIQTQKVTLKPEIPVLSPPISPPAEEEQEIPPPSIPEEQPSQEQEEAAPSIPEKEVSLPPLNLQSNVLLFKSLYGNISLKPASSEAPLTLVSGQTLKSFVKPKKPVKAIKVTIIFRKPAEKDTSYETKNSVLSSILGIPSAQAQTWRIAEYTLTDENNDGIYEGEITLPETTGEYTIRTTLFYTDGTLENLDTETLIDPKGYIYTPTKDNQEIRINKATISLYAFNPETGEFELWQSIPYGQENPQTTDKTGEYEFLVPEGKYYLQITAKGYQPYKGEEFQAQEGDVIHQNIELIPEKGFNWKWLIAIGVLILGVVVSVSMVLKKRKG